MKEREEGCERGEEERGGGGERSKGGGGGRRGRERGRAREMRRMRGRGDLQAVATKVNKAADWWLHP